MAEQPFRLGQHVQVRAVVQKVHVSCAQELRTRSTAAVLVRPMDMPEDFGGHWHHNYQYRCLTRHALEVPVEGVIVGYTWRFSGTRVFDYDAGWQSSNEKGVKVWRVATSLRWSEPLDALSDDLEVLDAAG